MSVGIQEELATVTAKQQQLIASESAARQQLAVSVEAHEKSSSACSSAEVELHRLSLALGDSEAQLLLAQQKEAQVRSPRIALQSSALCPHMHHVTPPSDLRNKCV